jgi:light-harvesting complex II chlorophyll a/b binding protein 7
MFQEGVIAKHGINRHRCTGLSRFYHSSKHFHSVVDNSNIRAQSSLPDSISLSKDVVELAIFSSAPFILVQAFADSKAGKSLLARLEAERPLLQEKARQAELEREKIRQDMVWYGEERPMWLGPIASSAPEWLDGSLPGDYGFDPFSLARESKNLDRYVELEILHARWAMLGALGALIPELLQLFHAVEFPEYRWWNVGAYKLHSGEPLNYFGIEGLRVAGGQGIAIIAFCQVLLMFGPEYARACGIQALEPLGIFLPGDKNYPGGWLFDPLNLSSDPKTYEEMRVREIKNGRLAMVAWVGFAVQAATTGQGPLENVVDVFNMTIYNG